MVPFTIDVKLNDLVIVPDINDATMLFFWTKKMSDFNANVVKLMMGTSLAQAIPIAISPILTRLYTPAEFGTFALYISVAAMLSVVVTGRYELAIMLPRSRKNAFHLVILASGLSFILSALLFIMILFFNHDISSFLGNSEISVWLYLLPGSVLLTGCYQSVYYWVNREKKYGAIGLAKIVQTSGAGGTNIAGGWAGGGPSGLILGNFLGQTLAVSFLAIQAFKTKIIYWDRLSFVRIYILSKRYINFPKFDILASLMNVSSHQVTIILFGSLYNSALAGQYFLTQRILGLPLTLVAASISDVFREEAAREYKRFGSAKKIFIETFVKLILIGLVPSIILFSYAQELFVFVFSKEWRISGEYAQLLVPMFFFKVCS